MNQIHPPFQYSSLHTISNNQFNRHVRLLYFLRSGADNLYEMFWLFFIDALLIIGLPDGPTAHFKLSKLVLRKDIKVLVYLFEKLHAYWF